MILPRDKKKLTQYALKIIEDCRISTGQRAAAYRSYGQWMETGRAAGGLALANMLYGHIDRLGAHLFSPSELRFAIDYESIYDKPWLDKAAVAARVVSREWERKNIDVLFGHGVKEALGYGSYLLKQLAGRGADGNFVFYGARLVPPWSFGVYEESVNDLAHQEAFVETVYLNRHEVWRRVRSLPDSEKLFRRITATANKETGIGVPTSFMHQVLSTAVLNTNLETMTQPQPGGIVQLSNDPNFATLGPQVAPQLFAMHELWVKDDEREGGYTTIQLIEPDILIAPLFRKTNLFIDYGVDEDGRVADVSDDHPFTLIQPNFVPGYFWGRSELVDLLQLQEWLTSHLDSIKRLMEVQVDKVLGFEGIDAITDELYAQMTRVAGTVSVPQGAKINDLTPNLPPDGIQLIGQIISLMDKVSGFPPIMSGSGEPGVRAGVHADTLMKTGSPRLRDRSLLVERQCATAADVTLSVLQAKKAEAYWTDPERGETEFLLSQLPNDRRIAVDAHTSSPIYADDNANLIAFGVKAGFITGESAIEQLPYNHKDILVDRLKQKQAAQEKLMMEHPEFFARRTMHPGHS